MKLRNKKTGEIIEFASIQRDYDGANDIGLVEIGHERGDTIPVYSYRSLAELNNEWEDYKESGYWYYDTVGNRIEFTELSYLTEKDKDLDEQIGNHFETKEEAVAAVEKLKAYKRLKDKGFKFSGVKGLDYAIEFEINSPYTHITYDEYTATEDQKEFYNDLMLLFGGEE